MHKLVVKLDRAGAGKHVSRWKRQMDQTIRRAVKASRRATGSVFLEFFSGSRLWRIMVMSALFRSSSITASASTQRPSRVPCGVKRALPGSPGAAMPLKFIFPFATELDHCL